MKRVCACVLALLACVAGAEEREGEQPRLVVLALQPAGGVEPAVAASLTEAVTAEVARTGLFRVTGAAEVATLLGFERQKQMVGCSEEGSCLAEVAGALGARFVLSGSVARLGQLYQLNLQTLDSTRGQPVGRATRMFDDLGTLRAQLAYAVAEATGTPLPPPPSRVLPYTLMATGSLAAVGGGVLGLLALSQEGAIQRELDNGVQQPLALKPMSAYQAELAVLRTQRTLSLVGLSAGVALVGLGFLFNPADPLVGVRPAPISLTVSGRGVGVAGLW